MDSVEELVARDRIRDLAVRYALAVDAKDLDGVASLFVEDVDNGRFGIGRAGVRRFYDQSLRNFHCSVHLVANHVIDFHDDCTASGIVYCQAQHHMLDPEHWFDVALAYWDDYEAVNDTWLLRRRRVRSWYRQELGHPQRGTERTPATPTTSGPQRGGRMPEAFSTFEKFWGESPRESD